MKRRRLQESWADQACKLGTAPMTVLECGSKHERRKYDQDYTVHGPKFCAIEGAL